MLGQGDSVRLGPFPHSLNQVFSEERDHISVSKLSSPATLISCGFSGALGSQGLS